MNKNKFGQETEWALYKITPSKDYPCTWYFWINPDGKIVFQRSVESLGYMPITIEDLTEKYFEDYLPNQFKKVSNHSMTDEHLSKGWLLL